MANVGLSSSHCVYINEIKSFYDRIQKSFNISTNRMHFYGIEDQFRTKKQNAFYMTIITIIFSVSFPFVLLAHFTNLYHSYQYHGRICDDKNSKLNFFTKISW